MTEQEQKAFEQMREALKLCYEHCRVYHPEVDTNNVGQSVRQAITAANAVQPQAQGEAEVAGAQSRFKNVAVWTPCSVEHHKMVQLNPNEWDGYETRLVYALPQATEPSAKK